MYLSLHLMLYISAEWPGGGSIRDILHGVAAVDSTAPRFSHIPDRRGVACLPHICQECDVRCSRLGFRNLGHVFLKDFCTFIAPWISFERYDRRTR